MTDNTYIVVYNIMVYKTVLCSVLHPVSGNCEEVVVYISIFTL